VLYRIATARQDPWGRLQIAGTGDGGLVIEGMRISPSVWHRLDAAQLLLPSDAGPGHVTFGQRGLMHFALLLAARDGVRQATSREPAPGHAPNPGHAPTPGHAPPLRTAYVVSGS
jgi:hypothetical protein